MKFSKIVMASLVAWAFALMPGLAPAANINIDDATEGLVVSVDAGNWEFGVSVTPIGPEGANVTGGFISNTGFGAGGGLVLILEGPGPSLSDWMRIQWTVNDGVANFDLLFFSDVDGVLPPPPVGIPVFTMAETGDFQELAGMFPGLLPQNITVQFRSDVEKVPAPSVLALILAGLLPLGWSYSRRRG